ncbi:hypothetical protein MUK42_34326, partial [Musa troglodytarum]
DPEAGLATLPSTAVDALEKETSEAKGPRTAGPSTASAALLVPPPRPSGIFFYSLHLLDHRAGIVSRDPGLLMNCIEDGDDYEV